MIKMDRLTKGRFGSHIVCDECGCRITDCGKARAVWFVDEAGEADTVILHICLGACMQNVESKEKAGRDRRICWIALAVHLDTLLYNSGLKTDTERSKAHAAALAHAQRA